MFNLVALDDLRDKVHSVQENLSSSFRVLNVTDGSLRKKPLVINDNAGGDMLHKFLNQWNEIHTLSVNNSQEAQVCDEKIHAICNRTNLQLSQMMQLWYSINVLPKLSDKTAAIIQQTQNLETQFKSIENSLLYLEEIVHIQKVQETQLEKRFELAMHAENELKRLELLRRNLEMDYNEKVINTEEKKAILSKERQKTFDEAFKQDLETYKQGGSFNNITTNKVNPPSQVSSLEDVELDVDDSDLNKMLTGT